jgi:hypothetical protein
MPQANLSGIAGSTQPAVGCQEPERRARASVRMPAWIVSYRHSWKRQMIKVRDLSQGGIFFYSDFCPRQGDEVEFVLKFPKWTNSGPITCKGKVVRVEESAPAVGVAVSLNRYFVLR